MSEGKEPGFLHFLQRLFGLGGDKLKPSQPAPPAKKNRPSHAPNRKRPGKGSANKEPSSDKLAKKEPASRDKPAKKGAAKAWGQTEGPASCRADRSTGRSSPPHERPAADRKQESPEEKTAPSVYTPATPGAKPVPPPAGPATVPGKAPPEDLLPAERKTGKPNA